MTFGTARDLSLQVVAISMTSFGMLMNSLHGEFQRIGPQKRAGVQRYAAPPQLPEGWRRVDIGSLIRHQPDEGCLIANFAILPSPGVQEMCRPSAKNSEFSSSRRTRDPFASSG